VTSPFKHSQQHNHVAEEPKRFAFKGLNLVSAFDSKIEKFPSIGMEICGKKEDDFDFKVESF
jgi:hypothetical protein